MKSDPSSPPVPPRTHRASLRRAALSLALTAALATSGARGQGVDPRLYEPALAPGAVLGVDTASVVPHLGVWGGLFASFANDELVTRTGADATAHGPLRNRLVTTVAAGLGLFDALEIAVGAPLHLVEVPAGADGRAGELGFGDLRVGVRARLFGPDRGAAGVGLALGVDLTVPTGGARPFTGDDGVGVSPRLALDWRSRGGVVLALNAGYRLRGVADVDDLAVGDEVRFGVGAEIPLGVYGLAALGEVLGSVGLAETDLDPSGVDARKVPVEALAGFRWRSTGGFAISAAAGAGLTAGYGAPDYRVVFALVYGGPPADPFVEAVLDPALGDAADDDPVALAAVPPLDAAAFDAALAEDPDPDGDGIPSSRDACPDEPEDFDGFEDDDGCPDPEVVADAPPAAPVDGVDEADGRLIITDSIRFTPGSAELTRDGELVLDKVALFMSSRPQIARVRIEGHTDSVGDKEFNVDLAERRAWSVRSYLMAQGVDGARLLPKGFGPTRPVATNATESGRAKNRRVEFHIMRPGELLDDATQEGGQ